jgi:hypothetical protein
LIVDFPLLKENLGYILEMVLEAVLKELRILNIESSSFPFSDC